MTHADFNAISRQLFMKLDIYFDATPLTVTRDNFLVDLGILEDTGVAVANPLGAISANELAFKLFNTDGIFAPTNVNSPYYGKILVGVKIVPYISADTIDWLQMGVYYVSNWNTTLTSSTVSVTAHNNIRKVLNGKRPHYPVRNKVPFDTFFQSVFEAMGQQLKIIDSIPEEVEWAYIKEAPKSYLSEMAKGAIAICTTNRYGENILRSWKFDAQRAVFITDSDQIKTINLRQSVLKTHEGVELTWTLPVPTLQEEIQRITELWIPSGRTTFGPFNFSKIPVRFITWMAINTQTSKEIKPWLIQVESFSSTTEEFTFTVFNHGEALEATAICYGMAVDLLDSVLTDNTETLLKVKNTYIQSPSAAETYKRRLNHFVGSQMPTIELEIRGNALLNIGDSVIAYSEMYDFAFAGIIQKMDYNYNGGLSCKMTLLNAEITGDTSGLFHPDLFVNFRIVDKHLYFEYPNGLLIPVPFPFSFDVNATDLILTTTNEWPNPFSLDEALNLIYHRGLPRTFHPDAFKSFKIIDDKLYFVYPTGYLVPVPFTYALNIDASNNLILTIEDSTWINPFSLDEAKNLTYTRPEDLIGGEEL